MVSKASSSKKEYIRFMKRNLIKNNEIKKIINNYIKYLLNINTDFSSNKQNHFTHKTFNNKNIFKMNFSDTIPQKIIYEIFIAYIELIMYNKESILFSSNISTIREDFPAKTIKTILNINNIGLQIKNNFNKIIFGIICKYNYC